MQKYKIIFVIYLVSSALICAGCQEDFDDKDWGEDIIRAEAARRGDDQPLTIDNN